MIEVDLVRLCLGLIFMGLFMAAVGYTIGYLHGRQGLRK